MNAHISLTDIFSMFLACTPATYSALAHIDHQPDSSQLKEDTLLWDTAEDSMVRSTTRV